MKDLRQHRLLIEKAAGLPWAFEVHKLSEGQSAIIYDSQDGRVLADHLNPEVAAFITSAVNLHFEMLDALLPFASNFAGRETWPANGMVGGTNNPSLTTAHLRAAYEAVTKAREAML